MWELFLQNFCLVSWDSLVEKGNMEIKIWHIFAIYLWYQVLSFVLEQVVYRWRQHWTSKKAAAVRAKRDTKHYEFGPVNKDLQIKLLKMDCGQLRGGLDEGAFTSVDLVNFYGHRCQTIGRELELTTEELFESAMVLAKKCDKERAEAKAENRELPYMHGIPFSVKDMIDLKGCHTTSGCQMLVGDVEKEDAYLLEPFLSAGAIPLIRGNVPQASLGYHSFNYIWGAAKNPLDHSRVAGGSCGGDGALVVSNCIPYSIGVELGGSLRLPACFLGLIGMKPTQGRFLIHGMKAPRTSGFDLSFGHLKIVTGPLTHSVQDAVEFFKLQCQAKNQEQTPFLPDTYFDRELYNSTLNNRKGLKIGYLEEIPSLPVSAAVKRGLRMAKQALIKAGYEVVDFKITDAEYRKGLDYLHGMVANGTFTNMFKDMRLHGETLTLGNWANNLMVHMGSLPRKMILGLLKLLGEGRLASTLKDLRIMEPFEYEQFVYDRYMMAEDIHKRWQEAGLTALISPLFPHCAFPVDKADDYGVMLYYTYLWSLMYYPGASYPITKVREDEQTYEDNYNDLWTKALQRSAKGSAGMPISVQVVGQAFKDENVLAVMKVLEEQVGRNVK